MICYLYDAKITDFSQTFKPEIPPREYFAFFITKIEDFESYPF